METSPLIRRANQWTGYFMIGTSVIKELSTHNTLRIGLLLPNKS